MSNPTPPPAASAEEARLEARAHHILESAPFRKLVSDQRRVSILGTIAMLTFYFGFILLVAFNKPALATKIGDHVTVAIPIGLGLIIIAWVMTGLYVNWANTKYDKEVTEIKNHLNELAQ